MLAKLYARQKTTEKAFPVALMPRIAAKGIVRKSIAGVMHLACQSPSARFAGQNFARLVMVPCARHRHRHRLPFAPLPL